MKFLLFYLTSILLIHHVTSNKAVASKQLQKNGPFKISAIKARRANSTHPLNKVKNFIRATRPVLVSPPNFTKEEMTQFRNEEKNATGTPEKKGGKVGIKAYIVKGQVAKRGDFPWQVGIIVDDENFCGGSLISQQHVLTAGHCVYKKSSFELIFGAQDRSTEERGAVTIISKRAVIHSGYNEDTLINDIAIIFVPQNVRLTEFTKIIRLPKRIQSKRFFKKGVPVQVAGWGRTSDGNLDVSDVLKTIRMNMLNSVDCLKAFGKSSFGNSNLCALGKNGDATCQGDSGGALVYKDLIDDIYTQVGLVSYGAAEGCESGYPEVFTKVAFYIPWIASQTKLRL